MWFGTLDEAIALVRGAVQNWRFKRDCTFLIHCGQVESQYRVDMKAVLPLPFDDELEELEKSSQEQMMDEYWKLVKQGALN